MQEHQSLEDFLSSPRCADAPEALKALIRDTVNACIEIASLTRNGSLAGNLAASWGINVQDETQKALDVISNDILINAMEKHGHARALASEEMDDTHIVANPKAAESPYFLAFDPLDGSSNIDINGLVGTIFSVLPAPDGAKGTSGEMLIAGREQAAAGYVLYGPSTVLILTLGNGVVEFTLDAAKSVFRMTKHSVDLPVGTSEFSINASNRRYWEAPMQRYIDDCLAGKEGPRKRDFNMRWVGAMVGDVHRVVSRGGVFLYPIDEKTRAKGGRLRLLYEANPMSMIVEQAGGRATDGHGRILDIAPSSLHQRVPVVIGSREEIDIIVSYHEQG
ncbi:MAG: class 1 fructose-bisphosphatase [Rhodospirillales bacterium]